MLKLTAKRPCLYAHAYYARASDTSVCVMRPGFLRSYLNWYENTKKTVKILFGNALWYSSGEKPLSVRWVLVQDPNTNQSEAFFSTDLKMEPQAIVNNFVLRWNIEVTFAETRAHLGVETQRQWSDKAIARTTPVLMALFSLVCLFAKEMSKTKILSIAKTAWYDKKGDATFSDVIAFVRREIWASNYFNDSANAADHIKINRNTWETLMDQLVRAA